MKKISLKIFVILACCASNLLALNSQISLDELGLSASDKRDWLSLVDRISTSLVQRFESEQKSILDYAELNTTQALLEIAHANYLNISWQCSVLRTGQTVCWAGALGFIIGYGIAQKDAERKQVSELLIAGISGISGAFCALASDLGFRIWHYRQYNRCKSWLENLNESQFEKLQKDISTAVEKKMPKFESGLGEAIIKA
jgi:hypothetical protein